MKKVITFLFFAAMFATILTVYGCGSSSDKVVVAQENVNDAKLDLKEAQNNADVANQKTVSAEEWKAFRTESELKIQKNEIRIEELKAKKNKPGKLFDKLYATRIEALQKRNMELRVKMDAYEKNHSDWEAFKREFNHDMDEIGQALKDITVNNKD